MDDYCWNAVRGKLITRIFTTVYTFVVLLPCHATRTHSLLILFDEYLYTMNYTVFLLNFKLSV